ncbi:hypothetical protein DNTS_030267 [Danionella cerebrum]|uniref:Uncharacterized protein n=1 Tax=Danionella cerebrum TaxID=2873325 RepID=A0A553NW77_9TELE|nr:hypothetical protein DNTS_030267 [Danionella translucida]
MPNQGQQQLVLNCCLKVLETIAKPQVQKANVTPELQLLDVRSLSCWNTAPYYCFPVTHGYLGNDTLGSGATGWRCCLQDSLI